MAHLISVMEREVTAKGLIKSQQINREKIKDYFFDDEYQNFSLLKKIEKTTYLKKTAHLLYPGSGSDILTPLLYLEQLISEFQEVDFLFIDIYNYFGLIKTILDDLNISFSQKSRNAILFYWNNMLVKLEFIQRDIFSLANTLPSFDIYFEKNFRIMKEGHPYYESYILEKLKKSGMIISDSGFQNQKLRIIPSFPELSIYKEMIIGIKQ